MEYLIIGAGIGGLTLALAFEEKGIDYKVYERFSKIKSAGAGIWLAPNALQVFEELNVLDEIKSKGNSIDRITIGNPDLTAISDNDQQFVKSEYGYSAIAIHRTELQKILFDKIPAAKIHLGKAFETYVTSENKVIANFADGSSAGGDYLVGADGINSKVRAQLFPNSIVRYSGQTCWRGVAETVLDPGFNHHVYELWGNQVRFGISRISEGKYYWFAVALDVENKKDEPHKLRDKLMQMYKDFDPAVNQIISNTPTDKVMRNDITDLKPMPKWYKNNICLIGDAGHATTPNMGQGGGQAIEDAHYLSNLQHQSLNENIFEEFQKRREAKVNGIVKQSWMMGKMAHWKYGRGLRNLLLKSAPKKMVLKKVLEMYEIEKFSD